MQKKTEHGFVFLSALGAILVFFIPQTGGAAPYEATTTVSLTVCGDSVVSGAEFCDDGTNTGAYGDAILTRNCNPLCRAYGPYCGDGVIQTLYGEECDDSNNTAGDLCDVSCQNEQDPVTEGGSGGGSSGGGGGGKGSGNNAIPGAIADGKIEYTGTTEVLVSGRAYPGATVTVLLDGTVERVVEADGSAVFSCTLSDLTPGITTLGFWALDGANRRSITYSATFQVVQNARTTLSGLLLPPTLAAIPDKVAPGGNISFVGSAAPAATVRVYLDNIQKAEETLSSSNGSWSIAYNTTPLAVETFHTAKAHYLDTANHDLKSGYSQSTNFYVGTNAPTRTGSADLNGDGKVNLTDFSILLFHWNTSSGVGDINADGAVSLPDFSIMLYEWTG